MERYQHCGRDDPVPVKLGPKCIDPNRKDARFTFHTGNVVHSALHTLLNLYMQWTLVPNGSGYIFIGNICCIFKMPLEKFPVTEIYYLK